MDAILKRRSVRKYNDIPIPKDVLVDVLISAQFAPHSGNSHTCRLVVIDEESVKDSVSDACFHQTWMKSAPIFIVIASNLERMEKLYGKRGVEVYSNQNSAAIAENMAICAMSHNVATCWVSAFNEKMVAQVLDIPDNFVPQIVMTFGYSSEIVPTPVKQDLTALTYLNKFEGGGRFNNIDFLFKDYSDVLRRHLRRAAKTTKSTGTFIGKKINKILKK